MGRRWCIVADDIADVLPGAGPVAGHQRHAVSHRVTPAGQAGHRLREYPADVRVAEGEGVADGSWHLHGDAVIPHPGTAQASCPQGTGRATGRILIVGDDPAIRALIGKALAAAGYVTDLASPGTEGLGRVPEPYCDLIILDLPTVGPDGPLAQGRLPTRREAHLHGEVIRAGQLSLDLGRLAADTGHGPVPLTRLEFLLLRELAEHAGQPVPKSKLLRTIWGYDFDPGSNVVDVCVRRLRSKLGFDLIKTVRGEGYQLVGQLPWHRPGHVWGVAVRLPQIPGMSASRMRTKVASGCAVCPWCRCAWCHAIEVEVQPPAEKGRSDEHPAA
jgi:DNA-binding response OmpR family regulator